MVRKRKGTFKWAMEEAIARIMHEKAMADQIKERGIKMETRERPAPILERLMKRTRG
jgi:hypothetical protein